MTRDPVACELLAVTYWHPDLLSDPVTYTMPAQPAATAEMIAWTAAKDWASRNLSRDWIATHNTDPRGKTTINGK